MKPKVEKESWDSMISRCAWLVTENLVMGRCGIRSSMVEVFNVMLGWFKEHGRIKA